MVDLNKQKQDPGPKQSKVAMTLPIGTGLGIVLGLVMGNLAVGIAIGTALGVAIGVALDQHKE
jgi:mannose/fructose/N-acetylgalactosamine-specific phosphotransferase system component IIC